MSTTSIRGRTASWNSPESRSASAGWTRPVGSSSWT